MEKEPANLALPARPFLRAQQRRAHPRVSGQVRPRRWRCSHAPGKSASPSWKRSPPTSHYQREPSFALNNVGRIRESQGEFGPALEVFARSQKISESLVEKEPANLALPARPFHRAQHTSGASAGFRASSAPRWRCSHAPGKSASPSWKRSPPTSHTSATFHRAG